IDNPQHISLTTTDITVHDSLSFNNGKIFTGANIVTIDSSATVTGEDTGKYIVGTVKLLVPTGATTRSLNIGDTGIYAPVTYKFTNVTSGGSLTGNTDTSFVPGSALDDNRKIKRRWTVINNGVNLTTTQNDSIFFSWSAADNDPALDT